MKLLNTTRPAELPTDALLARLRGRRATISLAAEHTGDASAMHLLNWVYRRLNLRLRQRLQPFLEQIAMRNLTLILRYALIGEMPPATLLSNSLLADELKQLLTAPAEPEEILGQLQAALIKDYPFVSGLTTSYRSQGPGGVEQQLADGILRFGLSKSSDRLIKRTLRYLIDMRNCLMINKLWRWQASKPPPLSSGGQLSTEALQRIWAAHDSERLTSLTSRLAGEPTSGSSTVKIEQALLQGMTRLLRRARRDPLGLAIIVEYLWLAQLTVHNQVLRQALLPEREDLLEEVLLL